MKLDVIGLVDVVTSPQNVDIAVINKLNEVVATVDTIDKEVTIKIEEVQTKIDNIEKGHIDWNIVN
jgi:energy-converting hydrogenase Eha subunit C